MREDRRVRMFLQGVVMLNLVVLGGLFLAPRVWFLTQHWGMKPPGFLQSGGTFDLPNLYARSYELAFAVRQVTPESARIWLPPVNGEFTKDSVLYQVLLPRRLRFAKTESSVRPGLSGNDWLVFRPKARPEACSPRGSRSLGNTGYVICRAG